MTFSLISWATWHPRDKPNYHPKAPQLSQVIGVVADSTMRPILEWQNWNAHTWMVSLAPILFFPKLQAVLTSSNTNWAPSRHLASKKQCTTRAKPASAVWIRCAYEIKIAPGPVVRWIVALTSALSVCFLKSAHYQHTALTHCHSLSPGKLGELKVPEDTFVTLPLLDAQNVTIEIEGELDRCLNLCYCNRDGRMGECQLYCVNRGKGEIVRSTEKAAYEQL